jgi:hypothetical protein
MSFEQFLEAPSKINFLRCYTIRDDAFERIFTWAITSPDRQLAFIAVTRIPAQEDHIALARRLLEPYKDDKNIQLAIARRFKDVPKAEMLLDAAVADNEINIVYQALLWLCDELNYQPRSEVLRVLNPGQRMIVMRRADHGRGWLHMVLDQFPDEISIVLAKGDAMEMDVLDLILERYTGSYKPMLIADICEKNSFDFDTIVRVSNKCPEAFQEFGNWRVVTKSTGVADVFMSNFLGHKLSPLKLPEAYLRDYQYELRLREYLSSHKRRQNNMSSKLLLIATICDYELVVEELLVGDARDNPDYVRYATSRGPEYLARFQYLFTLYRAYRDFLNPFKSLFSIMSLFGFFQATDKMAYLDEYALDNPRNALNVDNVLDYAIRERRTDIVLFVARTYRLLDNTERVTEYLCREGHTLFWMGNSWTAMACLSGCPETMVRLMALVADIKPCFASTY